MRVAEPVFAARAAVVHGNAKAAGKGEDNLFELSMRVPPALGVDGHVVEVINPTDLEWDMVTTFDES